MRLKSIDGVKYDPTDRSISFKGRNALGKSSEVQLSVADPREFLAAVSTVISAVTDIPITGIRLDVRRISSATERDPYFITMRLLMDGIDIKARLPGRFRELGEAERRANDLQAAFEVLMSPGPKAAN